MHRHHYHMHSTCRAIKSRSFQLASESQVETFSSHRRYRSDQGSLRDRDLKLTYVREAYRPPVIHMHLTIHSILYFINAFICAPVSAHCVVRPSRPSNAGLFFDPHGCGVGFLSGPPSRPGILPTSSVFGINSLYLIQLSPL